MAFLGVVKDKNKIKRQVFVTMINGQLSFQRIIETGKYSRVDHEIQPKYFPIIGQEQELANLAIFPFIGIPTGTEVFTAMKEEGCEFARTEHLLFFGVDYPTVQLECPISALGSVWHLSPHLPMVLTLTANDLNQRLLKLDYLRNLCEPD